jgi:murein DD-endopeptidase MepM/ murein hydrolase activator NlpD
VYGNVSCGTQEISVTVVISVHFRHVVSSLLSAGLVLAMLSPAYAADPHERRRSVEEKLGQAQSELRQSTQELADATSSFADAQAKLPAAEQALAEAEQALAAAQERLARARGELAAAKARDAAAAAKLKAAEQRVRDQEAKIAKISSRIDGQRAAMSQVAVEAYQQGAMGQLLDISAAFKAEDVSDFTARVTYAQSVLNAEDTVLTDLETDRADLANERVKLEELREEARRLREEAARHLQRTKELEAAAAAARAAAEETAEQARAAKAAVDKLVRQRSGAVAAAEDAKSDDATQYAALQAERQAIDAEIAELARQAREERARKARAEAAKKSSSTKSTGGSGGGGSSSSGSPSRSSSSGGSAGGGSSGGGSSSSGLRYPVANPYITSPYGMRVHPVTGIYKLHDGTDFRAYCGTPIRAAAGGRVLWARYRVGYGNQVAIDHGVVGGNPLMTSYSHLSRFSASWAERVSAGEVIGYSGTTGYSTACHLHFMVYDDGVRTNPMRFL